MRIMALMVFLGFLGISANQTLESFFRLVQKYPGRSMVVAGMLFGEVWHHTRLHIGAQFNREHVTLGLQRDQFEKLCDILSQKK